MKRIHINGKDHILITPKQLKSEALTSFNREWTRFTIVTDDMVGHTFSVYDGNGFIPIKVTHSMIGKPLIECTKLVRASSVKNEQKD